MNQKSKTLRLRFPQWQGGNNPSYVFGSEMLAWLAPVESGPVEVVAVEEPTGEPLPVEDGVVARRALIAQAREARQLIERHQPDRIVILGGDCLVELAPFAYLNERYGGDLAILWVDTHPDIMSKAVYSNAHAMVMGNLLGEGEAEFTQFVPQPIKPENVMFAGLRKTMPSLPDVLEMETAMFERLNLRAAGPEALATTSAPVIDWLKAVGAKHVAVHLDLDVLDPSLFRSILFANPDPSVPKIEGSPSGAMTMEQVVRLLSDVSDTVDIVGLGITEHLPWDSMALKEMLANLPLIGREPTSRRNDNRFNPGASS